MTSTGMARDPPSGDTSEGDRWRRWRETGDAQARERLIASYLPYARIVAATYYARRMHDEIEFDEYLQFARVGMLEALDRYDPDGGAQFKTFAARRMHGAILDGIDRLSEKQRQIAVQRQLRAERLQSLKEDGHASGGELFERLASVGIGLALGFLLEDTGMFADERGESGCPGTPYERLELRQLQSRLRALVSKLPDNERLVIRNHYLQGMQFDQIAVQLGLTKGRVSQIHKQALASLRLFLGARQRCDVAL
jgi:RNA polymerase sigma factor FliA